MQDDVEDDTEYFVISPKPMISPVVEQAAPQNVSPLLSKPLEEQQQIQQMQSMAPTTTSSRPTSAPSPKSPPPAIFTGNAPPPPPPANSNSSVSAIITPKALTKAPKPLLVSPSSSSAGGGNSSKDLALVPATELTSSTSAFSSSYEIEGNTTTARSFRRLVTTAPSASKRPSTSSNTLDMTTAHLHRHTAPHPPPATTTTTTTTTTNRQQAQNATTTTTKSSTGSRLLDRIPHNKIVPLSVSNMQSSSTRSRLNTSPRTPLPVRPYLQDSTIREQHEASELLPLLDTNNQTWAQRAMTEPQRPSHFRKVAVEAVFGTRTQRSGAVGGWDHVRHLPRQCHTARDSKDMSQSQLSTVALGGEEPQAGKPSMFSPRMSAHLPAAPKVKAHEPTWRRRLETEYGVPLSSLLGSVHKTDLTLQVGSSIRIEVHKTIVGELSPVVRDAERHGLIALTAGDCSALMSVLQYIYLGRCRIAPADLAGVWKLAEQLEIRPLQDHLRRHPLHLVMSRTMCSALLELGKAMGSTSLINRVRKFEQIFPTTAPCRWYLETTVSTLDVAAAFMRVSGSVLDLDHPTQPRRVVFHAAVVETDDAVTVDEGAGLFSNNITDNCKYLLDFGKRLRFCISSRAEDATASAYAFITELVDRSVPPPFVHRLYEEKFCLCIQFSEKVWGRTGSFLRFITAVQLRSARPPTEREVLRSQISIKQINPLSPLGYHLEGLAKASAFVFQGGVAQVKEALRCILDQEMGVAQACLCVCCPGPVPFSVVFNHHPSFIFDIQENALYVPDDIGAIERMIHCMFEFAAPPILPHTGTNGVLTFSAMHRAWSPSQPPPAQRSSTSFARWREHHFYSYYHKSSQPPSGPVSMMAQDSENSSDESGDNHDASLRPKSPPKTVRMRRKHAMYWHADRSLMEMGSPMVSSSSNHGGLQHSVKCVGMERVIRDIHPPSMVLEKQM